MISVLLIEDEVAVAEVLKVTLEHSKKFVVINVTTLVDGIRILKAKQVRFDIVLLDLTLPDSKGEATLNLFQSACPECPFIVVTGGGSLEKNPIAFGAQDYILKGQQSYPTMEQMIVHAIERHKVRNVFTPLNELIQEAKQMATDMKAELNEDKRKAVEEPK